jgi:hypothetical protein
MPMRVYPANERPAVMECPRPVWNAMADYFDAVAPDISTDKDWHSYNTHGLDAAENKALADILQTEIDSGRTKSYAQALASVASYATRYHVVGLHYSFEEKDIQEFTALARDGEGLCVNGLF